MLFWGVFALVVSLTGCARDMDLAIGGGPAEQGIPNLPLGKWGSCDAGPPPGSPPAPSSGQVAGYVTVVFCVRFESYARLLPMQCAT